MQPKLHKRAVTKASTSGPELTTDCANTHGRDISSKRKGRSNKNTSQGTLKYPVFCFLLHHQSWLPPTTPPLPQQKTDQGFPCTGPGQHQQAACLLASLPRAQLSSHRQNPSAKCISITRLTAPAHFNCSKLPAPQQKFNSTATRALWRNSSQNIAGKKNRNIKACKILRFVEYKHIYKYIYIFIYVFINLFSDSINADRLVTPRATHTAITKSCPKPRETIYHSRSLTS